MDLSRERDEWLMSQVSLGKRDHLEPLVRRYASPLMTFIQKMIGNRHQSEEVFQEVFLAVWKKRSQYRFPRRFKSWLYGIAVNKCRTQLRTRANPTSLPYQNCDLDWVQSSSEASPDHVLLSVEAAQHVVAGVTLLPLMQRTVVVLRVWQSLPYSEIAEVLGKSTGTVRSHMHHGLASLRRYLEPRMR